MDLYVIRRTEAHGRTCRKLEAAGAAKSAGRSATRRGCRDRGCAVWIRSYVGQGQPMAAASRDTDLAGMTRPPHANRLRCRGASYAKCAVRPTQRRIRCSTGDVRRRPRRRPVQSMPRRPATASDLPGEHVARRRPPNDVRRSLNQGRRTTMNVQTAIPATIDLATIKSRQQVAWGSGDYAMIGTTLQIVGEMLCEAVDLRSNQRVLDVAAGNGNATLAAARRFADVVSTDYVGALLERGRERAEADRLPVTFQEADAEALPFAGCELRRRAFDLRRHVHAEPGAGRERTDARLPPGRQDRPRQLDAGELHRPAVQDHRQIRSAGTRREVAGAVGHQGASRHAVRLEGEPSRRRARTSSSATSRPSIGSRSSAIITARC